MTGWPGRQPAYWPNPGPVAGERGHDRTFHAACVLIQGFDLAIDEARPLLSE